MGVKRVVCDDQTHSIACVPQGVLNLNLIYIGMKLMKIVTSFKLTPWKLHSVHGEKIKNSMNVSTLFRFCNIERLRIVQF